MGGRFLPSFRIHFSVTSVRSLGKVFVRRERLPAHRAPGIGTLMSVMGDVAETRDDLEISTRKDKGPMMTNSEHISHWNDEQLFQLSKFYRERLKQAIEERVEELTKMLRLEGHISKEEHEKVTELVGKRNRPEGSKVFFTLVMGKGSRARRVMWEAFVKMRNELLKLDRILKEIQELGADIPEYMNISEGLTELPPQLKDVHEKHKKTLWEETEKLRVNTILLSEKVKVFKLVDRYAELTVISSVRERRFVEHELLARGRDHEEWRMKHLRGELEKIRADQLLQSSFSHNITYWQQIKRFLGFDSVNPTSVNSVKPGNSAAVAGVPGIGKTTMMQKIVYDWATGKIYQHYHFVFSFKFRDLNTINREISLTELILQQYPYFENSLEEVWKNPEGLLFIFDGLDELKDGIDFTESQRDTEPQQCCADPEFRCLVSDIVYNLIQHKLLPGCSVLVTTRPTALHSLEKAEISVWAEILGFVGEERKEYFNRHFEDQTVAAAVFKHVKENEILYTMSYNPSYCWILTLALGPFFSKGDKDPQQVPKTITQLYSYYIYYILKNHGREIENPRDVLLRVGQMAFTGVSERKIVFTDGDLINYNLKPSQFLSGFLMELLQREDSARCVVYTFPHLTIQEFVAAVAQFLTSDLKDTVKILAEACCMTDGRFEVFLRFVAGLSSGSAWRWKEFLGPFPVDTACQVIDFLKGEFKRRSGNTENEADKRSLLNTLHYLFESQNRVLAQEALGSVEKLSLSGLRLTPIDCAVLSHVIGLCDTIKHLDLDHCYIQCEGLQRLAPSLHRCQELGLANNDLGEGDSAVNLISAALRDRDCKIEKLRLGNNRITASQTAILASALVKNRSLTELDMKDNRLGDTGVKELLGVLNNSECKIQKLGLKNNSFTALCARNLACILRTNHSLIKLELDNNKLEDSGMKLLSEALRNPHCKIQELRLCRIGLTASGAEYLASALATSPSLVDLALDYNNLGDSGVKLIFGPLNSPDCKIQKLRLWDVALTDSFSEDLAMALKTNCSLKLLSLGDNKIGDSGVKRLSGMLVELQCKLLELDLYNNGLTDSSTQSLCLVLNRLSSLKILDLGGNSFTDESTHSFRRLILRCKSLKQITLTGNRFTADGQNHLLSLRGTRRGLNVKV
ncbi:NACHT, LRR and PYD domains-containing protein 3-like isoform X1 [Mobula hypostoma]|uniref:NACHT, LRR and PYD domains-containing protein 3-like isoform X1 n=4 Tax=Mobula hypostoma TaxID=723540 RepID=UPI002FC2AC5D